MRDIKGSSLIASSVPTNSLNNLSKSKLVFLTVCVSRKIDSIYLFADVFLNGDLLLFQGSSNKIFDTNKRTFLFIVLLNEDKFEQKNDYCDSMTFYLNKYALGTCSIQVETNGIRFRSVSPNSSTFAVIAANDS